MLHNTDRDWKAFGKHDPYFGVLTHEKYHHANITDERKAEFFRSGYLHVANALGNVRKYIDPTFTVQRALDFGCGVGRLVIPLAEVAEHVTGVDVSAAMLREAKRNCDDRSIANVDFINSDDALTALHGKYDFIHSHIVFQHIPVRRGNRIFANLLPHLTDGGVCVVHFTYSRSWRSAASTVLSGIPLVRNIVNLVRGRNLLAPQMQMNTYDLNGLLLTIQNSDVRDFHSEFTDHGDNLGIVLYFKKPAKRPLGHKNGTRQKVAQ